MIFIGVCVFVYLFFIIYLEYTTFQKFEVGKICFWKSLMLSMHLFDKKYSNNLEYYCYFLIFC